MKDYYTSSFKNLQLLLKHSTSLIPQLNILTDHVVHNIQQGHTLFFMGNGGSAADAQHMSAELIGRFEHERVAIPSIALSTDTSVLTSLSNDYSYDIVFSRQLEALCKKNDVVIGLSTSGNSQNIIKGFEVAKANSAITIAYTGESGGQFTNVPAIDYLIKVPHKNTRMIQEIHHFLLHDLCSAIEKSFVTE